MSFLSAVRPQRRRLWQLGSLALFITASIALVYGTAPMRAEQALKHASLMDLQFESQMDSTNPRIFYHLGLHAQQAGKVELALNSLGQAATLSPHDEGIWLTWARAAAAIRGSHAAIDILSTFLTVHPHSAQSHLMAAQILSQLGQHNRAYAEARAAAQADPSNARGWRLVGTEALEVSSFYVAEDAFRHAVALAPGDWANQQGLGDALYSSARYQDSVKYYRESLRLASLMGVTHLTLGEALLHTAGSPAEFESARALLREALVERDTLTAEGQFLAYLSLGQSYLAEQRWRESLPWLQQAVPYEPSNAVNTGDAHFELARAYRGLHDPANAAREMSLHSRRTLYTVQLRTLVDRISAHPDDAQAYVNLARLYAAHDDMPDAANFYQQAIARDPGLDAARREYAALLQRQAAAVRQRIH